MMTAPSSGRPPDLQAQGSLFEMLSVQAPARRRAARVAAVIHHPDPATATWTAGARDEDGGLTLICCWCERLQRLSRVDLCRHFTHLRCAQCLHISRVPLIALERATPADRPSLWRWQA
jgi:hypothetical protein